MGNCASNSQEAEGKARSDMIDRQIEEDSKRYKRECKILLLGACLSNFRPCPSEGIAPQPNPFLHHLQRRVWRSFSCHGDPTYLIALPAPDTEHVPPPFLWMPAHAHPLTLTCTHPDLFHLTRPCFDITFRIFTYSYEHLALPIGSGESGKSTIVKQMKIIHQNGYSREELLAFRPLIWKNLIESGRDVVQALAKFNLQPISPSNKVRRPSLRSFS